jgi:hypothetical protein
MRYTSRMEAGEDGDGRRETPDRPASGRLSSLVLAGAAAAVVAAVGPGGDFPLSDDWAYAFTARELCTRGELRFLPWTGASLVLQAWYGAALCRLLGFSFTVLRASTLVLAAAGAAGALLLLRRAGARGGTLALGALAVGLCPLYVSLAFTFMTDVPFTVLAVLAGVCYARGLAERRRAPLLAGGLLAAAALLVRQHGILLAAAAAGAALAAAGRPRAERWRAAAAAAALPALAFAAFQLWLFALHGAPQGVEQKLGEAGRVTLAGLANCAFRGLATLGLLLSPLAIGARGPRALAAAWHALLAALALALYLREGALMPYLTNVMYDLGLGALTLRDTLFLGLPPPVWIGAPLAVPLTVLAVAAAARLATVWTAGLARLREPVPGFLLLATALLFAGTLLHARYYFDRYLLAVVPFAAAATLALRPRAPARPVAFALALALAAYAVTGTHDYLAWNRARAQGLAALRAAGVPLTAIDAGMELNAWHLAPTLGTWPSDAEARPGQPPDRPSWWWVVDDRFVVSFRPLAGYRVYRELAFTRWLPPGRGRVLVLERLPPDP